MHRSIKVCIGLQGCEDIGTSQSCSGVLGVRIIPRCCGSLRINGGIQTHLPENTSICLFDAGYVLQKGRVEILVRPRDMIRAKNDYFQRFTILRLCRRRSIGNSCRVRHDNLQFFDKFNVDIHTRVVHSTRLECLILLKWKQVHSIAPRLYNS